MERYNHLNSYLKDKFGERVLKICVDAHFSCPNRDGCKGIGGCIFCGEDGAGENIKGKMDKREQSIQNQVLTFLSSYRGERANKFIVYFQAFSNTYDSVGNLKRLYDIALGCSPKIVGLQIATRPDLINDDVAKLLNAYKEKYYVCVELGLQTASDQIGDKISRGYSTGDFASACKILNKYDIDIVAHMMVGLPNETKDDILHTVDVINNSGVQGVKIHNTYILEHTRLAQMYDGGEYAPITQDYYVEMVGTIIERLRKDIIIHRITGDPPKGKLVAPSWMSHKKIILNAINKYLETNNIIQGQNYLGDVK